MEIEGRIRPATHADVPAVRALFAAWEDEGGTWGLRSPSAEKRETHLADGFLVFAPADEAVAFPLSPTDEDGCVFSTNGPYLVIDDLHVAPAYRRQGIGSALVQTALAGAAARGITQFSVYSGNEDWRRTQAFYPRLGFRMWCLQMNSEGTSSRPHQPTPQLP